MFYLILRSMFVGAGKQGEITEVLNNPFVFATNYEARATQLFVLLKYIRLLIFPHPLSADYSWQTIPYRNFGNPIVWFSIVVHLAMIYFMVRLILNRNWIGFAIAFYLFHLFLVSNLVMPIGATMGERLIYHSSLGFAMVVGYYLLLGLRKILPDTNAAGRLVFVVMVLVLTAAMGYKTMERNPDWETDNILFMHDAWVVPNSVLANGNAGKAFIEGAQKDTANRLALLDSAIYHLEKAVSIHPKYVNGYLNLGLAWFQKQDLDKAEFYWNKARENFPTHPFFRQSYDPALVGAFIEKAKLAGRNGNVPLAIQFLARALKYDSTNAETWYHYGGANFQTGNLNEAYIGFSKCLQLNPNYPEAQNGLRAVVEKMKQHQMTPPVVK
jgi:Flp pilus assembly protein TadD